MLPRLLYTHAHTPHTHTHTHAHTHTSTARVRADSQTTRGALAPSPPARHTLDGRRRARGWTIAGQNLMCASHVVRPNGARLASNAQPVRACARCCVAQARRGATSTCLSAVKKHAGDEQRPNHSDLQHTTPRGPIRHAAASTGQRAAAPRHRAGVGRTCRAVSAAVRARRTLRPIMRPRLRRRTGERRPCRVRAGPRACVPAPVRTATAESGL